VGFISLWRYAARPLQQVQDLGGLAPPGRTSLFLLFGRFFGELAFLADVALRRNGARCRATLAFLFGFGWSPVAVPVPSAIDVYGVPCVSPRSRHGSSGAPESK